MQLYSTHNKELRVDLRQAVFQGLPADNGLFMPLHIPQLSEQFFADLPDLSLPQIGIAICQALFGDSIPTVDIVRMVEQAIDFPAPLVKLDEDTFVLELFHGPSLAFKDFGARFMAQLMSYFNRGEDEDLVILVATSGDTGGAVAAGFHRTPGIKVVILYPSGQVSALQEKQLTTLGDNVQALEIAGTFDDCQAIVKQAFLDSELRAQLRLSSANSINIARLIPQSFYYFEAYKQLMQHTQSPVVFSVPSGNFGNLTAGLLANRMGLPVERFIAATNINDVVPAYLRTSHYHPRSSERTLSNAMDVGNPSNFMRMLDLHKAQEALANRPVATATWEAMQRKLAGYSFNDEDTADAIKHIYASHDYLIDPHGAVGYLAWKAYQQRTQPSTSGSIGIVLETAHPAKFQEDMERIMGHSIALPAALADLAQKEKVATALPADYAVVKDWLLERV